MKENKLNILGIAGSLRRDSYNKMLIKNFLECLPEKVDMEIFDLANIPLFNQDLEQTPPDSILKLKNKIRLADGIIISTPEYNYSIPGVIKNAIDWVSRPYNENPWTNKPIAIVGASIGGFGTVRAQLHLRQTFFYLKSRLLQAPEIYISNASEKFDDAGYLKNTEDKEKLCQLFDGLIALIERLNKYF